MYVRELTVQYRLRKITPEPARRLCTPAEAAAFFTPLLADHAVEVCLLACLSTRHDLLAYHELSRGTIDRTLIEARDVFRTALLANAAGVILAHNHPSGDPSPSPDDLALTRRIHTAGQLIGVSLEDHVIVGGGSYYSLREAGHPVFV